jgi:hypothetical protein
MRHSSPTRRLDKFKTYSEIFTSVATVIGALVAAGWALNEYSEKKVDARVQTTLEYRREYDKGAVLAARQKVGDIWIANEDEEIRILNEKPAERARTDFYGFMSSVIRDNKLQQPISIILEFFEVLKVCLERRLCDDETLLGLFGDEAVSYSHQLIPFIDSARGRWQDKTFAQGLDHIASLAEARRKVSEDKPGGWWHSLTSRARSLWTSWFSALAPVAP